MAKLAIVLPTLNEAAGLRITLDEIHQLNLKDRDIIVVDSFSQDGTNYVAYRLGAKLLTAPRGKGTAICYVWNEFYKYDYMIMLDADGTYPASYIPIMLQRLMSGNCDVIAGVRILKDKEAMSVIHQAGNWCFTFAANFLYKTKTIDLCTGYWGFNKKAIGAIQLTARKFDLEANIFTEMNRNKLRFEMLPIRLRPRVKGEKPKIKFRDSFDVVWKLIAEKFRR